MITVAENLVGYGLMDPFLESSCGNGDGESLSQMGFILLYRVIAWHFLCLSVVVYRIYCKIMLKRLKTLVRKTLLYGIFSGDV